MDISFSCDTCGQHIAIDEAGAGAIVECPKCRQSVLVPSQSADPPARNTPPSVPHFARDPVMRQQVEQPASVGPPPKIDRMAIASLVLGILGVVGFLGNVRFRLPGLIPEFFYTLSGLTVCFIYVPISVI